MTEREWTQGWEDTFQCFRRFRRRGPAIKCDAGCGSMIEPGDDYVAVRIRDDQWYGFNLHKGCLAEGHDQAMRRFGSFVYEQIGEVALDDGKIFDVESKTWVDEPRDDSIVPLHAYWESDL